MQNEILGRFGRVIESPMCKLYDCCWAELEGFERPELVIRKRLKPAIYAVGEWLYSESGSPLPHHPDAPRILAIHPPMSMGKRRTV